MISIIKYHKSTLLIIICDNIIPSHITHFIIKNYILNRLIHIKIISLYLLEEKELVMFLPYLSIQMSI